MTKHSPRRADSQAASVLLACMLPLCAACNAELHADGGLTDGTARLGPGGQLDARDSVPVTTRVARITHRQYDNATSDLLGLDVALASEFQADAIFSGYDNNVDGLRVEGRLGRDYRRAAEELAALAANDTSSFEHLVPCEPSAADCSTTFVRTFGERAFRRPLTSDEQSRLEAAFAEGPTLVGSGDAFADGVQVVVEAVLQSPKFLYRAELGTEVGADGTIALEDYEIASRLSFLIWETTPDDELLGLASRGELHTPEQIEAAALRLLASPRAEPVVLDFHRQWLDLAYYRKVTKNQDLYPGFGPELTPTLQAEALDFVREVTFGEKRGLHSLLTAPYTFVDGSLAPYYGEVATGPGTKLDLDPAVRGGFLTQIGFLASHAYSDDPSPIHRGVFVLKRILCVDIPPPPGDVDFTLPEGADALPTKREKVELQTSSASCRGCHSIINPVGFAFEEFDAVGQHRTMDNGAPVDTTGTVELESGTISFDGAVDLVEKLAGTPEARSCYARNWLRYAMGREDTEGDARTLDTLTAELASDEFTAADLLLALTQTRTFRSRAPNQE